MSDDYSQRAAKGQAYNLAVLTAIADGKHQDTQHVLKQYYKHLRFSALLQKSSGPDILTAIENPKLEGIFNQVEQELSK